MRARRIVLTASLLALGLSLGACETFDPTDWFSTKKPLPGERKDVFPGGVPGVPQGVPPELLQGYQPPAEPAVVEEKPRPQPRPRPRPQQAASPPPQQQQQQAPQRTRVTIGAPQQAPAAGGQAWPDPQQGQAQPAPAQGPMPFPDPPRR